MRRVKQATYQRFITGPIPRFDDRRGGFSKLQRGEVVDMDTLNSSPQKTESMVDRMISKDPAQKERKG